MATHWQIGNRISNRWDVCRVLKGDSTLVYVVYDAEQRRVLAAKTLLDAVFTPALGRRFAEQARAWIALGRNAHVVQARALETIEDRPFLFMDYVSGGHLGDWLGAARLADNLPQALRLAIQFCDGMIHARAHGIAAHGDIRPQNCLITRSGLLKLSDFGMARLHGAGGAWEGPAAGLFTTRIFQRVFTPTRLRRAPEAPAAAEEGGEGILTGAPPYLAPEQFSDPKHADVRADIYSFGVLLFEMLAGKLPFVARTRDEFERLHRGAPPPAVGGDAAPLDAIVQRCLAKDPAARFGDFEGARAALAQAYEKIVGQPAPQPPAGAELDALEADNDGSALAETGFHAQALDRFDEALGLNPKLVSALLNMADLLRATGKAQEALVCYDRALAAGPREARALTGKGMALLALKRLDEAGACAEEALAAWPRSEAAQLLTGMVWSAIGQANQAIECFDRVLAGNPRSHDAWIQKALVMRDAGRLMEAIACCEQALELNPRDEESWVRKGEVLGIMGRQRDEVICYDRALEINPRNAEAWFNKGSLLCSNFHRYREAMACFEEAQKLGHPRAADGIATCRPMITFLETTRQG
jgi:tetratricopeptide (TPR) repeat protein